MNMLTGFFICLVVGFLLVLAFQIINEIIWGSRARKRLNAARKEYDGIVQKFGSPYAASQHCPHKVVVYYKVFYPSGVPGGYYPRCKFCGFRLEWCLHPYDAESEKESRQQRARHGLYSMEIDGNLTLIHSQEIAERDHVGS